MGFFDAIGEAFSKNGSVTRFCEQIPGVGHITAGIQAIAGNTEEAKRALATSTGNLASAVGAVGGFCVGGPAGAMAGGALGGAAGSFIEHGIASTIDDSNVKGDVGELSVKKVLTDASLGGAGAMFGASKGLFTAGGKAVSQELFKDAAKAGLGSAAGQALRCAAKSIKKRKESTTDAFLAAMYRGFAPAKPHLGDHDPDPEPSTHKYVSQRNVDKLTALVDYLLKLNTKYSVTPISGPCVNAAIGLQAIQVGQLLALGTATYTEMMRYLDNRFDPARPEFQGGLERALTEVMSKLSPGSLMVDGRAVVYTRDQVQAQLQADYIQILDLRGIVNWSFESEYDEL